MEKDYLSRWKSLAAAESDQTGHDAHDCVDDDHDNVADDVAVEHDAHDGDDGDQFEEADDALNAIDVADDDAAEHDAHDGGGQDEGADDAAREAETERSQVFCHQGSNGRYVA